VAIFFAGVKLGAQIGLQTAVHIPRELGGGIISLMILFVAASNFYRGWLDRGRAWLAGRANRPGKA
jgi:simple sugar transport system permease protein